MAWSLWNSRCQERGVASARRRLAPFCEALETRVVLSTGAALAVMAPTAVPHAIHENKTVRTPIVGTITGQVTTDEMTRPLKNVRLQLIDSRGDVIETVRTGKRGYYTFKIDTPGPYVVRQVTPRGFIQTSPTFTDAPPSGALNPPPNAWSYDTGNNNPANGPVGPYAWNTVAPAGNLPFESPVNLTGPTTNLGSVLTISYSNSVPSYIANTGHDFKVQYPTVNPSDTISVDGVTFDLTQFHFHDPSEDTVNGGGYPMEMHFVNTSATGAVSVLAVFLQLGPHNDALDPILNALSSLGTTGSKTTISTPINFAGLLPANMQGWYYEGSLTAPPLSQTINWFVFSTPITLDYAQLQQYEAAARTGGFLPNNRPIQPTDGRQFNEIDYDVNFASGSRLRLNFNDESLLRTA